MWKTPGLFLITVLIFLSRIPFLSNGYGVEEDAWGMVLTARNIAQSGVYEYSRLPGHPVPELVYALISDAGAFWFNLLTAFLSTIGILFFMLALKRIEIKNYIVAGLALAFTPVIYVASTNTMDYTWAMSFILISFYLLLCKRPVLAGLALGIAIGCRMTSGLFVLPFLFLCQDDDEKSFLNRRSFQFVIATGLTGCLVFLPLISRYGFNFFDTYHTVYPAFAKAIYKFTIPVWGVVGLLTIIVFKTMLLKNKILFSFNNNVYHRKLILISIVIFLMHLVLFWILPQKAAFMIPAVPFVILIFALYLNTKQMGILALGFLLSCFMFGINLSDPYRGGEASALAKDFTIGKTRVAFDPLAGVVTDDYVKRKQRLVFSQKIISITDTLNEKVAVIAGWWLGDILVQQKEDVKRGTVFYYYPDELTLKQLKETGYKIYYLPEQDVYNDERAGRKFTLLYGQLWPY